MPDDESVSISATLEDGRLWKDGDAVFLNGASYTLSQGAGTSEALFENVVKADVYGGAYDIGNGTVDATGLTFTLPATQTASGLSFRPMVASGKTTELYFRYLLSSLRLEVKGSGTIKKITVSSNEGKKLSGTASVPLPFDSAPAMTFDDSAVSSLSADYGAGVELDGGSATAFDIVVPAGTYTGLQVQLHDADGGVMLHTVSAEVKAVPGGVGVIPEFVYQTGEPPVELSATIEKDANGGNSVWKSGAAIIVNGNMAALMKGENTPTATFGPVVPADHYYAVFPTSVFSGLHGNRMTVDIPAVRSFDAALADISPAAASSASTTLSFKYVAAIASVPVTGGHMLRTATLQSNDNQRLAGKATLTLGDDDMQMEMAPDASKTVTVDCGPSGIDLSGGRNLYFAIPAGSYTKGFTLTLTDSKGVTSSYQLPSKALVRNQISSFEGLEWEDTSGGEGTLCKEGWANCYMVHQPGTYSFDTKLVDGTPVDGIVSADWLWVSRLGSSSGNQLVSDISYKDGVITFTASEKEGNALIAAFDADGQIVWSWHIWLTDYPSTVDYGNHKGGGYYFMDRNLGAVSADYREGTATYGLLYQWGRKDPFIGGVGREDPEKKEQFRNGDQTVCNTVYSQAAWKAECGTAENGTIAFATANPMFFLAANTTSGQANWLAVGQFDDFKYDANKALWRPFMKTNYDPCPPGYQVPRGRIYGPLAGYGGQWWDGSKPEHLSTCTGFFYSDSDGMETWYPAQGSRSAHPYDAGALLYEGGKDGAIAIWSSELMVAERSWAMSIVWPLVNTDADHPWGEGNAVRCVKAYND